MKLFNTETVSDTKINFVDENNVLVGYDMDHYCCEYAGWFITKKKYNKVPSRDIEKLNKITPDLTNYRFNRAFFEIISADAYEEENILRFKLDNVDYNKPSLYLHLFNCHNGYYAHGFEVKGIKGIMDITKGYL